MEIRFIFYTAKLREYLDLCKRLRKRKAVTHELLLLKMSMITLEENLKKYVDIDHCPVRNVISHFSGKWSILILSILSENGTTRFNALAKLIPDISSKVLSNTLKTLEADGLISRHLYAEIPPRVEYSLTEQGRSLMPILVQLIEWSIAHFASFKR